MSPGGSIVASFENVESSLPRTLLVDHLIARFDKKGFIPGSSFDSLKKTCFSVGMTFLDNEVPTDSLRIDFLVLEFVLIKGSQVRKYDRRPDSHASFFVSDGNIEFLEQKGSIASILALVSFLARRYFLAELSSIHYAFSKRRDDKISQKRTLRQVNTACQEIWTHFIVVGCGKLGDNVTLARSTSIPDFGDFVSQEQCLPSP
ncbi:hypothetical protein Tco_0817421 [Tanacetum coccineum]